MLSISVLKKLVFGGKSLKAGCVYGKAVIIVACTNTVKWSVLTGGNDSV